MRSYQPQEKTSYNFGFAQGTDYPLLSIKAPVVNSAGAFFCLKSGSTPRSGEGSADSKRIGER